MTNGLQEEGGVTDISLRNMRILHDKYGIPMEIRFTGEQAAANWTVTCFWKTKDFPVYCHSFTGFSWGYRGEGPSGLVKMLDLFIPSQAITIVHIEKFFTSPMGITDFTIYNSDGNV